MPFKLSTVEVDGKTYAQVQDGKPLYVDDADPTKTATYDLEYSNGTIARLNRENAEHRQRAEQAVSSLKPFEGIEKPEEWVPAARRALETVANLDAKKLIDADKVEEVKKGVETAVKAQYEGRVQALEGERDTLKTERDKLKSDLDNEVLGGGFARSKYVAEKLILPPDIAQTYFGKHFKVEDGKPVAYDAAGNKIYSRSRPTEPADFDEAIEVLVDSYPRKDSILKGAGQSGAGSREGAGGDGTKSMTRAAFDALGPAEKRQKMADGYKVVDA